MSMSSKRIRRAWASGAAVTSLSLAIIACAAPAAEDTPSRVVEADYFVPSRPETLNWGWYPIDKQPVVTIRSGETVRINTLTHVGATQNEDPVEYLTGLGVPRVQTTSSTAKRYRLPSG